MKQNFLLGILLLSPLLAVHAADLLPAKPMIGKLAASKVLFLGNSITLHGPAPSIGWTGNWGMAASAEDKDYVHLVTADVTKAAGAKPETMARNIADFERGHDKFDIAGEYKAELTFQADLIIVAIGENVPDLATDEARAKYATAFTKLLTELKRNGNPVLFVRSSFWANAAKDDIMRKASADAGATFIDISKLGGDPSNSASSERKIDHAGVAAHPGDKGMQAIANAIFAAIQQKADAAVKP
jgi:lysophospholipase L1-like esterase